MDLSNKNMIHIKTKDIEYLQFRKLNEFGLTNCYTLSANNVNFRSTNKEKYAESLNKICKALNIEEKTIVKPVQTHTDCVKIVETGSENLENVDGLITKNPNLNLMLSFADCTPILIYDKKQKIIANVHSGWRGTVQKIGQKAALKMINECGSSAEDLFVFIGPCLEQCHFIVEEDVKKIFEETFETYCNKYNIIEDKNETIDGKRKYHINTEIINRLLLEEIGLKSDNIIESKICTACNSKIMHSHRIEKQNSGRNVAIFGMNNK